MSKKKINYGYIHEALDRLHIIMENIDDHIINHPICEKDKKIRKKVNKALDNLAAAYQLAGKLDYE